MSEQNRIRLKLSDIFHSPDTPPLEGKINSSLSGVTQEQLIRAQLKAQNQWFSAIATLEELLLSMTKVSLTEAVSEGLILCGPAPVLSHPHLLSVFETGVFTPKALKHLALMPCQFHVKLDSQGKTLSREMTQLPLLGQDPIAQEQFCLVLTSTFGLLMVLGEDSQGLPAFHFSFEPEQIQEAWLSLRSRLLLINHPQLNQLETLTRHFAPPIPDYRLVMEFSRQLLKNLPELTIETHQTCSLENGKKIQETEKNHREQRKTANYGSDIELLQALTHEIRTPLTTIRTMTRLLLKRAKLTPEMSKCLEVIDQECTEQINRMELIFRATEWGTKRLKDNPLQLVCMSVEEVLEQNINRWKKQAQRRNVELDVVIPQKLPQIVSDPSMLVQMLTGLMEKYTRIVPSGGQVKVEVTTAGNQLKLQFNCQSNQKHSGFKALGQLLMFQPDTGSLSLNLDVTKNLFHALGGKLIVRQRPEQGEVLTIFLPVSFNRLSRI